MAKKVNRSTHHSPLTVYIKGKTSFYLNAKSGLSTSAVMHLQEAADISLRDVTVK